MAQGVIEDEGRFPPVSKGVSKNYLTGREVTRHFERLSEPVEAVPTPFETWNLLSRGPGAGEGLGRGWHVILAGPPGAGKSLVGLNCAARAIRAGERVGYLNLEMSEEQVKTRLYSILSGVPVQRIERGTKQNLSVERDVHETLERVREKGGDPYFRSHEFRIEDVRDLVGTMKHWEQSHDVRLFVVDFLQRVRADARELRDKITDVSMAVADFAKDRDVTTLALSQLHRKGARGADADGSSPSIHDLYGGMSLEQDADQVLLLDSSRYESAPGHDPTEDHLASTYLILGKNRHGPTDDIPVLFDYRTLQVRELLDDEEEMFP